MVTNFDSKVSDVSALLMHVASVSVLARNAALVISSLKTETV